MIDEGAGGYVFARSLTTLPASVPLQQPLRPACSDGYDWVGKFPVRVRP